MLPCHLRIATLQYQQSLKALTMVYGQPYFAYVDEETPFPRTLWTEVEER